jgi:hypothetical protein
MRKGADDGMACQIFFAHGYPIQSAVPNPPPSSSATPPPPCPRRELWEAGDGVDEEVVWFRARRRETGFIRQKYYPCSATGESCRSYLESLRRPPCSLSRRRRRSRLVSSHKPSSQTSEHVHCPWFPSLPVQSQRLWSLTQCLGSLRISENRRRRPRRRSCTRLVASG